MYLGTIYLSVGPIGLQIWPPGGHLGKKQSVVTPELMDELQIAWVCLISIHDIIPRFLN
jgi:hypothetical protein